MTIAQYYLNTYTASEKIRAGLHFMEKVTYMSSKSSLSERIEIFSESLKSLKNDFGSVEIAL